MDHASDISDPPARFQVSLTNRQFRHAVAESRLVEAAHAVLRNSHYSSAAISLAVVDDAAIHELNRRYLDHDWPTDVLSFLLEERNRHLEGEVIISADTAAAAAEELGCSADKEQLLYVIHGMLHLIGYVDTTAVEMQEMRTAEAGYLRQLGFEPDDPTDGGSVLKAAFSAELPTRRSAP
jgi:probable rRNA maturation factor